MWLLSSLKRAVKAAVREHSAVVGSIVEVRTDAARIVLTFDDGPGPEGTEQVLGALADHEATATFFVLMTRVARYGSLLDEVLTAGHEIGLHGPDHQPLTTFRYGAAKARTAAAKAELEDRTGRVVRWFRPPYGRQTPATWRAVTSLGLTSVMWGPTIWDWRDVSQDERVWKAQQGAVPGAIVLGHDAFAGAVDGVPQHLVPQFDRGDLIRRVLTAYEGRGLAARSLGDVLANGVPFMAARFLR